MNTRSLIKHKNRCKQHFLIFIIFSRIFSKVKQSIMHLEKKLIKLVCFLYVHKQMRHLKHQT